MKDFLIEKMNCLLNPIGLSLMQRDVLLKQRELLNQPEIAELNKYHELFSRFSHSKSVEPDGAASYLRTDNLRLKELRQRYGSLQLPVVDHSWWTDGYVSRDVDLRYFRGDGAYMYQYRDRNLPINYILTTYYIQTIDTLHLLEKLTEDALFGAYVFDINDRLKVSRDLLDSIVEIYFLERNLWFSKSNFNCLDIGAGYGRLAHRIVQAFPRAGKVFCVDSVPESTFLCDYYLRFRGVETRAITVPLYEIESTLRSTHIDVVTNVCSFPECTLESTSWWLDLLQKYSVRYLIIVPNATIGLRSTEKQEPQHLDLSPAIASRGYKLIAKDPKYLDPSVQKYGVTPTFHYLFELKR